MTWQQTHRRMAALRQIESMANRAMDGELPWLPDYEELFGDRDHLLTTLRYRWLRDIETQLDPALPADTLAENRAALRARHAGVLRILARHQRPAVRSADAPTEEADRVA